MSTEKCLTGGRVSSEATACGFAEYISIIKDERYFVSIKYHKKVYAKAINITDKEFDNRLKLVKSDYMYDIVGYVDGNPVTRFNLSYLIKNLLIKLFKRIEIANKEPLTHEDRLFVLENMESLLNADI